MQIPAPAVRENRFLEGEHVHGVYHTKMEVLTHQGTKDMIWRKGDTIIFVRYTLFIKRELQIRIPFYLLSAHGINQHSRKCQYNSCDYT